MSITVNQAKNLVSGNIVFTKGPKGHPQKWKVTGKPKTWKTRPDEVKVPVKFGLYSCAYITEANIHLIYMTPEEVV